ncbi:hypothetical protein PanWU01x14_099730 [Parasponia andersonii]|uniref:Uncharacterized protein n=1 Tax=Parasponia andersonii TaxID=3476 RepID=A0A2P5D3G9_PARAD|nr:hypothetical protein PanWU01x14_099730 [Parasponia andersonii]
MVKNGLSGLLLSTKHATQLFCPPTKWVLKKKKVQMSCKTKILNFHLRSSKLSSKWLNMNAKEISKAYPVMAGNKKVICSSSPVPEWIFCRNHVQVVFQILYNVLTLVRIRYV